MLTRGGNFIMSDKIDEKDYLQSREMFKKREEYESYFKNFEKEQQKFIDYILEKYKITTKADFDNYIHLFPVSSAKFFTTSMFAKLEKQNNK